MCRNTLKHTHTHTHTHLYLLLVTPIPSSVTLLTAITARWLTLMPQRHGGFGSVVEKHKTQFIHTQLLFMHICCSLPLSLFYLLTISPPCTIFRQNNDPLYPLLLPLYITVPIFHLFLSVYLPCLSLLSYPKAIVICRPVQTPYKYTHVNLLHMHHLRFLNELKHDANVTFKTKSQPSNSPLQLWEPAKMSSLSKKVLTLLV